MESQLSRMNCHTFSPFDKLRRVEFRAFGRDRQQGDVVWDFEFTRHIPSRLIKHQDGMRAGRDVEGYLLEVQFHPLAVAPRQHKARTPFDAAQDRLAFSGTDRAKDIGGSSALVFWR